MSKTKLVRNASQASEGLDIKRLYLPGWTLESPCPSCGDLYERDFGNDYLSYPTPGEWLDQTFECECGTEWKVPIRLVLKLEIEKKPK